MGTAGLDDLVVFVAVAETRSFSAASRRLELPKSSVSRAITPSIGQLFASPAYLARRGIPRTPRDLDAHDWVRFRGTRTLQLAGPDGTVSVMPRGGIVANDMAFVRAALLHDAGIGVLPTFAADAEVAASRLVRVLPRWSAQSGFMWLVRPGGRDVPRKVGVFTELLLETLRARGLLPRETRQG